MTSWLSKTTLQRLLDLAGLHYTTAERSGPFWQSMLHNFLSRPLSFLDWTTAIVFLLDFHQTQTAAQLIFNEPKIAHVTPLFISLHWLPVAAHIKFKTVMLAYKTATGSTPSYLHSLITIYIPSRSLRSASERRLEAQNHFPEHSRSPFLAGGMIFPPSSGMLDPCQPLSNTWKLMSFDTTWQNKTKKNCLSLYLFLLLLIALDQSELVFGLNPRRCSTIRELHVWTQPAELILLFLHSTVALSFHFVFYCFVPLLTCLFMFARIFR